MKFTDQTGKVIELKKTPSRIISLVPSQTEFLFDLGLENEVIGITKFCVHPDSWFQNKKRAGGTKELKMDVIAALKPDLIIANKEENEKEQIEELCGMYPVWISDIRTLNDSYEMMKAIGKMTGREVEARKIQAEIAFRFDNFKKHFYPKKKTRIAYFIWNKPYMVAGHDTFIDHLLQLCGFENAFTRQSSRYPEITAEDLLMEKPEVILLSSEPYPFKQKHIDELNKILPKARIMLVDGELFSWYGSRLMYSPPYFEKLLCELNVK